VFEATDVETYGTINFARIPFQGQIGKDEESGYHPAPNWYSLCHTEYACFDGRSLKYIFQSAYFNVFHRVDSGGKVNILGGDIFGHREKKKKFDRVSYSE